MRLNIYLIGKLKMKITNVKEIVKGFGTIIPKSASMPILQCINIEVKGSKVVFKGTNLKQTMIYTIDNINSDTNVKMLVNFQEFRKLPDEVEIVRKGDELIATHGKTRIKLALNDESLFPLIPDRTVENGKELVLTDDIKRVIKTVMLATNKVENGVFGGIRVSDEIVATDSKRIYAGNGFPLEELHTEDGKIEVVIPLQVVNLIEQFDSMFLNKREVILTNDNWELRGMLLQIKYPNYEKVFPKDLPDWFTVTDEVISAVKEAGSYIPKDSFKVILTTEGKTLTVKTSTEDGTSYVAEMEVDCFNDTKMEMAFNQKYLLELCEIFNGEILRAGSANNPVLINNNSLRGLLMPLRVNR